MDGQEFEATGLGDMHIELPNGQSKSQILLKNVLYAPAMGLTLVSISKIAKARFTYDCFSQKYFEDYWAVRQYSWNH